VNQKLKNKINGLLLANVVFSALIIIYTRIMFEQIQASIWRPVGALGDLHSAITSISYSWTSLSLGISELGKYHHTVVVNNSIMGPIVFAIVYNIYYIIKVNRMKDSEEFGVNHTR
jgi:hypothetical protein